MIPYIRGMAPLIQGLFKILGAFATLGILMNKVIPAKFAPLRGNSDLHKEALKIVLVQRLGGVSDGGCKSAKDRFGSVRLLAQTYQDYIEEYKEIPPAIGSSSYYAMDKKKREFLDQQFADNFLKGTAQFVAHSNTQGASGIKNNFWILGAEHRCIINNEVTKRIENIIKKYNKDNPGKNLMEAFNYVKNRTKDIEELQKALESLSETAELGEKQALLAQINAIETDLKRYEPYRESIKELTILSLMTTDNSHKLSELNKFYRTMVPQTNSEHCDHVSVAKSRNSCPKNPPPFEKPESIEAHTFAELGSTEVTTQVPLNQERFRRHSM
jgi:hypothetical protein